MHKYNSLCLDHELKEVPVQFPSDESENNVVPSSSLQRSDVFLECTSSSACADQVCNDIGALLTSSKSMEEICASISNLSQGEMFSYLYRHVQPPSNLPATFLHGAN